MKLLKHNIFNGIILALAFSFNILFFAPLEMYYTNRIELWFGAKNILIITIPLMLIVSSILAIIIIKLNKKNKIVFARVIATLFTGLYLQGNYLNFGYSVLDGSEVEWMSMLVKGFINTAIWLFFIIFPYEIKKLKKHDNFKIYTSILSIFIMLIEIITLITLVVTNNTKKTSIKVLNTENILNLSKENNIVVFMADTFEGAYMDEILEKRPEYKEKLKDFIYFDNATSASFYTYSSMPTLLTGVVCKVDNTLNQNLEYCFENTDLYKVLEENNYQSEIYTEKAIIPNDSHITNLTYKKEHVKFVSNIKINKNLYKAVLYRYLPHFLKSKFIVCSDDFSIIKTENDQELGYKERVYNLDDVELNDSIIEDGITSKMKKNSFKFYQLNGMHMPYTTTEDLKYNQSMEYASSLLDRERRLSEGIATLNLMCNYVEKLKEEGIYDNTTIILLADHGYDNRFWVNLLIKKANENHEFQINSAPVSTITDLVPTILNIATNSKDYGKDFFDYKEGEERTRQVNDFVYKENVVGSNDYHVISKMVFESNKKASNKKSFKIVKEESIYDRKKLSSKYAFGTTKKINEIEDSDCINLQGIAQESIKGNAPMGVNISPNAYLTINRELSDTDVIIDFDIAETYGQTQIINFKINGDSISSTKLSKTNKNQKISVVIPKEEWNLKEEFVLEMEFPRAILGEQEFSMWVAVKLSSITIRQDI